MFRLEMVDDLGRVLNYPLKNENVISIGRQSNNDIVLEDKSVSRNHCLIYVKSGFVDVEDLDSANGVRVRGERIAARTRVNTGDELIIGENRFFLRRYVSDHKTEETYLGNLPDDLKTRRPGK